MATRQRLTTTDDGRPALVKHASPGPDEARLASEANLLRAAAHPGVVEVIAERELQDGGRELMLAVAGSRTAADVSAEPAGIAGLVAAAAATVADLHDFGIAHGRISAEHIVVDGMGRPVLCGFAEAARAEPGALPALARAADVAGLGALLRQLVGTGGDAGGGWVPIPLRRLRRSDRSSAFAHRALLNLADHATADEPSHRPSARALAAGVLAAVPEASLPGAATSKEAEPPRSGQSWRSRRPSSAWLTLGAGAVGLGLLLFGVGGLLRPPSPSPAAPAAATPAPPTPVTEPAASEPPPSADAPLDTGAGSAPPSSCPEVGGEGADVLADPDGDGCRSPVVVGDGVVEVDGVRYGVGEPDDLLAVGDWDCDGLATVALVHRGSGEVFQFERWATTGANLDAVAMATVENPSAVEVHDSEGAGCDVLVVVGVEGARTEIRP